MDTGDKLLFIIANFISEYNETVLFMVYFVALSNSEVNQFKIYTKTIAKIVS